jgi:hypothetical protein
MKTAVEWLREKLWKEFNFSFSDNILEQAKEMEKEQMKYFYNIGKIYNGCPYEFEQYYNKSFKNSEQ